MAQKQEEVPDFVSVPASSCVMPLSKKTQRALRELDRAQAGADRVIEKVLSAMR